MVTPNLPINDATSLLVFNHSLYDNHFNCTHNDDVDSGNILIFGKTSITDDVRVRSIVVVLLLVLLSLIDILIPLLLKISSVSVWIKNIT